jgi:hypothetical protein
MLMGSPKALRRVESDTYDGFHEDSATTHLSSNASRIAREDSLDTYSNSDPEHEGATPPRSRRKSLQYSLTPSPLKTTENVMKSVSKNLRRMSLRVVNLRNSGLEGQVRLADGENEMTNDLTEESEGSQPDLKQIFPIRGRALGLLGRDSKIRLALFEFLVHPYVQISHPICWLLIQLQRDGTSHPDPHYFERYRFDQAVISCFNSAICQRSYTAPRNQRVFSHLGGLRFVCALHHIYVSGDTSLSA